MTYLNPFHKEATERKIREITDIMQDAIALIGHEDAIK
jgi:hypothetical protein